ncbi:MAG: YraN family protein [Nitrospinae bacterium]|nr:YraN family protein [Nitrospinota bacterium]MZH05158.1 YraN family protein [Nitrospinota bacterium]MZH14754.1 YraN family protein [Nitrospinota bacterium]
MTEKRQKFGREGEKAAVDFLKKKGYRILESNFRSKLGEIDIIAERDATLVFLEVKSRADSQYGHPFHAVTPAKQRKIIQVAQTYLTKHRLLDTPARFDVVGVTVDSDDSKSFQIELLENAFQIS